jgi:hypothetical protein
MKRERPENVMVWSFASGALKLPAIHTQSPSARKRSGGKKARSRLPKYQKKEISIFKEKKEMTATVTMKEEVRRDSLGSAGGLAGVCACSPIKLKARTLRE